MAKECPHCEFDLEKHGVESTTLKEDAKGNKELEENVEMITNAFPMIECTLCGTISTWYDGELNSWITASGEQHSVYCPFLAMLYKSKPEKARETAEDVDAIMHWDEFLSRIE